MSAADQRKIARELAELRALVNKLIRQGDYPTYFGADDWPTIGSADQPQFQNNWSNFGAGWPNAGFRVDRAITEITLGRLKDAIADLGNAVRRSLPQRSLQTCV